MDTIHVGYRLHRAVCPMLCAYVLMELGVFALCKSVLLVFMQLKVNLVPVKFNIAGYR